MGWFGFDDAQRHNQVIYNTQPTEEHKSSWTHELIAGAAGFEAMKAYEAHCAANGQPPSHQFMKELLAGFAAAEVDKLFETKGLNWLDRERAKQHAIQQAHQLAEERYGAGNVGGYTGQFGQPYGGNQYGGVPSGYGGGNPYGGNAYGGNPYGGNPIPSGY